MQGATIQGGRVAKPAGARGESRERILRAAVDLFVVHGVHGTSLQMIANELGVTKAAVYFHFKAKDDIVIAVLLPVFDQIQALIDAAAAMPLASQRRATTLTGFVDLVVAHRRLVPVLHGDSAVAAVVDQRTSWRTLQSQLDDLLVGPDPTLSERIVASALVGGITAAGADARYADLSDETLRSELLTFVETAAQAAGASTD
jgi:AcrR family transcriptional regulator